MVKPCLRVIYFINIKHTKIAENDKTWNLKGDGKHVVGFGCCTSCNSQHGWRLVRLEGVVVRLVERTIGAGVAGVVSIAGAALSLVLVGVSLDARRQCWQL